MSEVSTTSDPASVYAASAPDRPLPAALRGRVEAGVCIVGGGYTGLNTGIALAKRGWRVVVPEATRDGWDTSGRNSGRSSTATLPT